MELQRRPLVVRELSDADAERWDAFVDDCPQATFFHRSGWRRVIESSLGHKAYYLYAERSGAIVGVLPLVHVNSRLFGNALISNAFCVHGGPLGQDQAALDALVERASALGDELAADYLEFRCSPPRKGEWNSRSDLYVSFRRSLQADPESNLLAVPRKQRAMIRKGIKAGLVSEIDDDVDRLHHIYAISVRNLGTPVYPLGYFRALKETFGEECSILTVCDHGEPVSSVLSFTFRDQVLPYYGGGNERARSLAANDFMYWEVMRRACEQGLKCFDFGRSKVATGPFAFKKNWGFVPEPLEYSYLLKRVGKVPDINPLNPKYRLFISLWKRLPLPLSKALGPHIARNLG